MKGGGSAPSLSLTQQRGGRGGGSLPAWYGMETTHGADCGVVLGVELAQQVRSKVHLSDIRPDEFEGYDLPTKRFPDQAGTIAPMDSSARISALEHPITRVPPFQQSDRTRVWSIERDRRMHA